ncbi:Nem1-Spo7 phosphatase regulatory subunit [Maudiozyma humilis]|uniref:Nem1-Spo7 phosphatase regulatory subunit n=1 Tax=Maudiozyma humilis TaxID=51915 RepID=A0AAV5RZ00_MAUHU|nr:Nem1-Spo7 phosphatase regulatory subunit [Kazachstania humilis]
MDERESDTPVKVEVTSTPVQSPSKSGIANGSDVLDGTTKHSSVMSSPLRSISETVPITPSRASVTPDSLAAERLDTLPHGTPSANASPLARHTPRSSSSRRRSFGRDSSGAKSRRNSTHISPTSMIFRNLLILEEDLRKQAREQKRLRWQYTVFLSCMAGIAAFAVYHLYFVENVVTGVHRFAMQFTACFITVTLTLFHLSGQYKRTIVIPRRFFPSTNKGLRQFNIRLVKVHSSWDESLTDGIRQSVGLLVDVNIRVCEWLSGWWRPVALLRFWHKAQLRCQPRIGAVDVKIVLNPRAFSAEIREGWEIYRDEFWAREGARRRRLVNGERSGGQ